LIGVSSEEMNLDKPILSLAALSWALVCTIGCTISVNEDYGDGHGHHDDFDREEACYDEYERCLDGADVDADEIDACTSMKDICLEGQTGAGREDPAEVSTQTCIGLQIACLEGAESLAEVDACEELFDHCTGSASGVCAPPTLEGCLAEHRDCAEGADGQLELCADAFVDCAEAQGMLCLGESTPAQHAACLGEHLMCASLASSSAETIACMSAFNVCLEDV